MSNEGILQIAKVYLRVALGGTFLTAIADRFGWLGTYGSRNVSWGDWSHFVQYVAVLNWFVPKSLIPALAAGETIIELGLGSALLLGIYQRVVAWSSAALLMSFCSHHEYCSWHSRAAELLGVHRARRRSNFGRSRTRPSHGSARSKLKQIILITCAEVRRELSSYIDNDVTPELRARIEQHVASCAGCKAKLCGGLGRQLAIQKFSDRAGKFLGVKASDVLTSKKFHIEVANE